MIRQTSIDVYKRNIESGLISELRKKVYSALYYNGPMTMYECARLLGIDRQSVTPRFTELEPMQLIAIVGERPCKITGNNSYVWQTTDNIVKPLPKKESNQSKIKRLEKIIEELNSKIKKLEQELFFNCK